MKRISKYVSYFLAFLLPFGSINPFNMSSVADVDSRMSEQMGFTPILFAICCLMALFDTSIYKHNRKIKKFLWPLGILFAALASASAINSGGSYEFPLMYLLKLLAVEGGFYIMALYFMEYPKTLKISMLIYAYTCVAIMAAFYSGLLSRYSYISNGRLWIFGENPNTFSFLMSLGTIILANKFNYKPTKSKFRIPVKILDIIAICSLLMYIVLSGSRGSFLIVILCMAILLFNRKMIKKFYITIPIVVCALAAGFYYYSAHQEEISIFKRLTRATEDERTELQQWTFELFTEKPILGYGVNGYKGEMMKRHHEGRDSHNVAITTLAMSGIVGFTALMVYLFYLLKISWKNRAREMLAFVFFIDVVLMSMKTGGVLTFAMMWYSYAMVVALANPDMKSENRKGLKRRRVII